MALKQERMEVKLSIFMQYTCQATLFKLYHCYNYINENKNDLYMCLRVKSHKSKIFKSNNNKSIFQFVNVVSQSWRYCNTR